MKRVRKIKALLDMSILLVACMCVLSARYFTLPEEVIYVGVVIVVLTGGVILIEWQRRNNNPDNDSASGIRQTKEYIHEHVAHELMLLNEDDKPVKSWDLTGKISMIIGRSNRDEEIDVDLGNCEYGALVSIQHAVLNFSLDTWYLEDLGSENGIKIKKADDGNCYQVASNRPVILETGDVIYIARTKLLFT